MKLQLAVFAALIASLVLKGDGRVVSREQREVIKRSIIVEVCNSEYPGSTCVKGCPGPNRVNGECEVGNCCKRPTDEQGCAPYGGACTDEDQCGAPKYNVPYRCSEGKICCFEPGNLCGTMPDNTTATCMLDCPERHSMPGTCAVGECCRPPRDNKECDAEFGNCVRANECRGYPKYSRPDRCAAPGYVCCFDPRYEMRAYWDTCYTRQIRVNFYTLSTSAANLIVTLIKTSTEDIMYQIILEIVPYVKMLTKLIRLPSSLDDYTLIWQVLGHDDFHGYTVITKCSNGVGWKDPHMLTFGGTKYNFNGYCSYTLAKDCSSPIPTFDISADFRGRYIPKEAPTRMVAVSTKVNGHDKYTFLEDLSVLLNGQPIKQNKLTIGDGLGYIRIQDDRVRLHLEKHAVSLEWIGKDHEAVVSIGDENLNGKLCGILGDGTKERGHDLLKSDGTKTFNTTEFAESWLIPGSCPQ